ncbi:MAG: S-layer family protein, partial [Planctomycetota bacterium]
FDYALTLSGAFAFKGSQLLLDGAVTGATTVGVNATTSFTTGSAGTINASGAFTQNGVGANYLGGNITADSLTFGQPVNLTGAVTMTTGGAVGDNILINNALNGAYDLTLVAGLGNVTLRNVGNIVDLNSIVVSSGAALNLLNAVEAGSFTATITGVATVRGITTAAAGSVSITATAGVSTYSRPIVVGTGGFTLNSSAGTVLISTASPITSAGIVSLTGATGISVGSNLTTADRTVNLVGATTLINDIAVTTGSGAVTFTGTVNGARNLVVNAGGQTEFTSTVGNSTPLSSLTLDGGASAKLGGSVTTVNALTLGDNVTLAANVTLATTNAPITVFGTVNGTTASTQTLGLTAGTGTITLAGALGGATRLGAMTVNSAGNLMAAAITATSLTQSAGTGTSTLDGAVNLTGNLAFTGRNLTINAGVTAGSTVAVVNTGVFTTGAAGDITATGAFTQSGSGGTNILAGDITTTNANVTLAGATQLAGPVAISTGAGAGNILFSNSLNGGQDLTLTGGTGNVSLNGAVGNMTPLGTIQINSAAVTNLANQVNAAAFTQSAGTGATTIRGINTTAAGGINVTATGISVFSRRLNVANGGAITLNATTGTLNLNANTPSVTASNTISLTGATVTIATAVNAGNNAITVTGDSLALTGSLNSGTANTTILTRAAGTAIDLGGAGSGSVLGISAAEVAKVTAGRLVVGSTANTGGISVTDSIALGSLNFSAITGTTINFATNGVLSGSLTTTDVVLTATGAITATGSTEDVVANTLTATAASIGTGASPLRTRVNNLSTNTSSLNGAQYLSQDSAVDALITAADINAGSNTVYLLGGKFVTATGCNILSSVEVRSGATLTGTGSVSGAVNILSGGIFFPGSSTSPYVGTISTGSVTMTSGSTFSTYMGSSNTCGAVSSSGVVALGGATLNITGVAAEVTTGNVFTLLTGTSLTGQFNGLAEAAIFSAGGKNFRINYTTTSVILTVVA